METRRQFLLALAASTALAGFRTDTRSWISSANAATGPFDNIPRLDGAVYLDPTFREASAVDYGHMFHRMPAAVLRPGSVHDVVEMMRFCNDHSIRVAIKGLGHSCYGQTQVEGGLVIDLSELNAIGPQGDGYLDVQPGALWAHIADATISKGFTPRVFATCMGLTAGGTLNVGGMGYMSHLYGAQVDHALELDVVTGAGEQVTCSPERDSELFNMVLGGQGQCGIIVRARVRLVSAPAGVILQQLMYADIDRYLEDQATMAAESRFDHQIGQAWRNPDGSWGYAIEVGKHHGATEAIDLDARLAGLHFESKGPLTRKSYREYVFKDEPQWAAMEATNGTRPAPLLAMWIPAAGIRAILKDVRAIPADEAGFGGIGILTMNNRRFTRPLLKVPAGDQGYGVWLLRAAPSDSPAAAEKVLASNKSLLARMVAVGGKRYAPFSMVATREDWMQHFENATWQRFSAAKHNYDPKGILSPNPNIFGEQRAN